MLDFFKGRLNRFSKHSNNGGFLPLRRFGCLGASSFKKLIKVFLYTLLFIAVSIAVLLCFALDNSPQTVVMQGMNREEIRRAKQLLHVAPDELDKIQTVRLDQKDLNIAVGYLLSHFVENTTMVELLDDRVIFQIAVFVPENPWGRYLDFHFVLKQNENGITIKSLKIGEISIPDRAANILIPYLVQHTVLNKYWLTLTEYVKAIRIISRRLGSQLFGKDSGGGEAIRGREAQ